MELIEHTTLLRQPLGEPEATETPTAFDETRDAFRSIIELSEADALSVDRASEEFKPFVRYLMSVGIDAKIAAVAFLELYDGDLQHSLANHGAYRGDLAKALRERWMADIVATIQNPSEDDETRIVAGYVCAICAARP
jgi:hypothetical protein